MRNKKILSTKKSFVSKSINKSFIPNCFKIDISKKNVYIAFGCAVLIILSIVALIGPFMTKFSYSDIDLYSINAKPSKEHILGTDNLGRDMLTRLLYSIRISLLVGVLATSIQIAIGTVLGLLSGYGGKKIDFIIMRTIDVLMCFPFFIVAISFASILGPSIRNLVLIISLLSWTEVARIVRAQTLSLKKRDFVVVSKVIGFSNFRIVIRDILPNVFPSIIVASTISMANAILMEASLSFLGLGVKDPMPSLGNILTAAQNMRALQSYWWTWLPAGILIVLIVVSINFIGEGFRIYFNPIENVIEQKKIEVEVDFELIPGRITALVGESGSGKTISSMGIVGLNSDNIYVKGRIIFEGENLLSASKEMIEKRRGSEISVIFQSPSKSLNPTFTVGNQVGEMYKLHSNKKGSDIYNSVIELFKSVKLENPEQVYYKYPHEISGGMKQRVQIACAIAANPKIIIADEPTTAIDDNLKLEILGLLKDISKNMNVAILFISHDLKRLENFADDIVVMKDLRIVEKKECKAFFRKQENEYSRSLVAAIPNPNNFKGRFESI
ncbi:dipeptide/oligopeptide/nickel ABC transporter permease/ATP-binding protein [Peptostreptococcus porci]|uniref:dipeptide/oligopeptide/nickel ABC transporter permease/ATP-binding protein n=1 Tax=Peptostreptococcus porci TaxID=2652282 RepID=UPI0023F15B61|nr:dipeptide/oligopeptide/nickel ABC transporter permease/ATP-binding protein [Peptostreptococcus porci]MDD7182558.1 dipeptide/oligopeptide/nickel ABC transporter permease/ATP-binding protein [Peptostreptococcus porci]MDY5963820.1 dipeptide/oligopeptide/nickel ABC transporter permease/ATP-binding protein [Peptostreptococcus porci]